MTDRIQTRTGTLTIQRSSDPARTFVMVTKTADASVAGVTVPTAELLAAIDLAEPYAMRSYLRETVPEADSSEDIDERPACPACDPEHDDIDEPHDTPDGEHQHDEADPVEQLRESGRQLAEAWRAISDGFIEASERWASKR